MEQHSRIYVAGHRGLVGSAITRRLAQDGFDNIITRTRGELDLTDCIAVDQFFERERPEYVFLAAAKVGGIAENDAHPAEFIRENLLIQTHVIAAAWRVGVRKLLFLGSSCIYPRHAPQPIREDALMTGALEPTNSAYAMAKLAGLEMCRAYRRQYGFNAISLMPTNLYGPGDNFDPESSHVLAALIRKFHEARERGAGYVDVWGTGTPRREFLHVDDLADAALLLMRRYDDAEPINVGTGEDISIRELAELIRDVIGVRAEIRFDTTRPDGTPRKVLDVARLSALGWRPRIPLKTGVAATYAWYRASGVDQSGA